MGKINLLGLEMKEIQDWMMSLEEKSFRARQIVDWIYKKECRDFTRMSNIRKEFRDKLNQLARIDYPEVIQVQQSQYEETRKYLVGLHDGHSVECVLMQDVERNTICISSQVGCPLECTFCLSGQSGFTRNLSAGEIISQVMICRQDIQDREKRLNIVMMGMGEPLLNYEEVVKAIRLITQEQGLGLGKKRLTLSTAGIPEKIKQLADDKLGIKLAVSLNAARDDQRNHLMPINQRYSLAELAESLHYFSSRTYPHRITFEYIIIKDINDSYQDSQDILRFLRPLSYKINLIPYNSNPFLDYHSPSEEDIIRFSRWLMPGSGAVTIRRSKGRDILAACGQLQATEKKRQ